jgi:hypothetical protein
MIHESELGFGLTSSANIAFRNLAVGPRLYQLGDRCELSEAIFTLRFSRRAFHSRGLTLTPLISHAAHP